MPKIHNTISQRKSLLFARITPKYLEENTSIFNDPIGDKKLDSYTVEKIKKSYKQFYECWIKDDAKKFLLKSENKD